MNFMATVRMSQPSTAQRTEVEAVAAAAEQHLLAQNRAEDGATPRGGLVHATVAQAGPPRRRIGGGGGVGRICGLFRIQLDFARENCDGWIEAHFRLALPAGRIGDRTPMGSGRWSEFKEGGRNPCSA